MDFTKKASGWALPKRYNTDVLQGNWFEDRMEFASGQHTDVNTTHRSAFRPSNSLGEDLVSAKSRRMEGLLRSDGITAQSLTHHHDKAYTDGLSVTSYDQDFARTTAATQPRVWDKWHSDWRPERSDFPIKGLPTHTGALEKQKAKWLKQEQEQGKTDYATTKQLSYSSPGTEAFRGQRFATPRKWSTHLHPHIQNRDLTLRGCANPVVVERFQLTDSATNACAVGPVG